MSKIVTQDGDVLWLIRGIVQESADASTLRAEQVFWYCTALLELVCVILCLCLDKLFSLLQVTQAGA